MNLSLLKFSIEVSKAPIESFGPTEEDTQRKMLASDEERTARILIHLKEMLSLGSEGRYQSLVALERLSWHYNASSSHYGGIPNGLAAALREDGLFNVDYISSVENLYVRQLNRSDEANAACKALALKTLVDEYGGVRNTFNFSAATNTLIDASNPITFMDKVGNYAIFLALKFGWLPSHLRADLDKADSPIFVRL